MTKGTIDRPRGAKRFRVRIYVSGKQETVGWYDTEKDAKRAMRAHNISLAETASEYEGTTLAKFGHKVLTRREVKGKVRDPDSDWSRFYEHIAKDIIGRMAVRAVQSRHVFAWVDRLEDRGLAPQTRRNTLSLLRTLFRAAHKAGLCRLNPCIGVRVEGKDKDAWTYLTRDELPRMLEAFPTIERHIAAVAIGTGVRSGELVSLRRSDVYLDDRPRIVVRYGSPPDKPTKTGAVRTVHLFGLSLVAMRSWMEECTIGPNPHGLVFPRDLGEFRDKDHIIRWDLWKAILKRAGITRRFRWYDFRHTCASWLVSGWWGHRWSLQEVKEMLGHTSITVTQRYAHLAASASEESARQTGLQVSASQLESASAPPALPPKTPEKQVPNRVAPPTRVERATNGLGIPRFSRSGAEIPNADSQLTRGPTSGSNQGPRIPVCAKCGAQMVLQFWDRPGGHPGNGWRCFRCCPDPSLTHVRGALLGLLQARP